MDFLKSVSKHSTNKGVYIPWLFTFRCSSETSKFSHRINGLLVIKITHIVELVLRIYSDEVVEEFFKLMLMIFT